MEVPRSPQLLNVRSWYIHTCIYRAKSSGLFSTGQLKQALSAGQHAWRTDAKHGWRGKVATHEAHVTRADKVALKLDTHATSGEGLTSTTYSGLYLPCSTRSLSIISAQTMPYRQIMLLALHAKGTLLGYEGGMRFREPTVQTHTPPAITAETSCMLICIWSQLSPHTHVTMTLL